MKEYNSLENLIQKAKETARNAYAPYSNFKVGAALLGGSGKVYTGCNVENVSYGATACAERVAVYQAVSVGEKTFLQMAIYAEGAKKPVPCGICRQVLREFVEDLELSIVTDKHIENLRLKDLYPQPFTKAKG